MKIVKHKICENVETTQTGVKRKWFTVEETWFGIFGSTMRLNIDQDKVRSEFPTLDAAHSALVKHLSRHYKTSTMKITAWEE